MGFHFQMKLILIDLSLRLVGQIGVESYKKINPNISKSDFIAKSAKL